MSLDKNKLPKPAIMNPNYISLPSEFDSSVSQLEMLQRMLYNFNELIEFVGALADEQIDVDNKIQEFFEELKRLVMEAVDDYFKMDSVFFGLTDSGYFVAYIPENWNQIVFNTTGYDINIPIELDYGHLVLSFDIDGSGI